MIKTILRVSALLLLACSACVPDPSIDSQRQFLGGDGGDDMPPPDDMASFVDLSAMAPPADMATPARIRPRYVSHRGAVVGTTEGFYDNTLKTTCTLLKVADQTVRCVPDGFTDLTHPMGFDVLFSDSTCSTRVLIASKTVLCADANLIGGFMRVEREEDEKFCRLNPPKVVTALYQVTRSIPLPAMVYGRTSPTNCVRYLTDDYKPYWERDHKAYELTEITVSSLAQITEP